MKTLLCFLDKSMRFREWLITESSNQVVLMKAVNDEGSESIKKGGFQLQDKHRSVANYYDKYGDTDTTQMYGPGLYFTIVPVGQDHIEYAKKNCKMYAKEWGNNIIFATIKSGSRGLVTGFPEGHAMWGYSITKKPDIYGQLEALGVNNIIGYKKGEIHTREEWGYKLHNKIDFWAHSHWAEGGAHAWNVVVYNPSILQSIGNIECEPGTSKSPSNSNSAASQNNPSTSGIKGPAQDRLARMAKEAGKTVDQYKQERLAKTQQQRRIRRAIGDLTSQNPTMVRRNFPT